MRLQIAVLFSTERPTRYAPIKIHIRYRVAVKKNMGPGYKINAKRGWRQKTDGTARGGERN